MKVRVKLAFKNGLQEEVAFEVAMPKNVTDVSEEKMKKKAFDKITRMVMQMGKGSGFINAGTFGFRAEDVSSVKLMDT